MVEYINDAEIMNLSKNVNILNTDNNIGTLVASQIFGKHISLVYLAIEILCEQTIRPDEVVLS